MLFSITVEAGTAAAYSVVGLALMALGFVLIDLLTPGKLREHIWLHRNRNAAVLVASNLLGVGIIVTSAIAASADAVLAGLVSTVVYGVLGLVLMGLSFLVVDLLTPGDLGALLVDETPHPVAWVTGASHLAVAAIVSAALL
ncbi:MAG: DUF350 domain-containing protein [Pseudonocardiaceae bacterium]